MNRYSDILPDRIDEEPEEWTEQDQDDFDDNEQAKEDAAMDER